MSPEKTQRLFDAFPHLYRGHHKPVQQSLMSFGFECGDGWFELLWRLSEAIEKEAARSGIDEQSESWPEATQVKQKGGGLRFYLEHATPTMMPLIEEAEKAAEWTCQECGADGASIFPHPRNTKVLCPAHADLVAPMPMKKLT